MTDPARFKFIYGVFDAAEASLRRSASASARAQGFGAQENNVLRELNGHPQSDRIVRRMDQILLRAQVSLCRLHGGVAQ